VHHSQLFVSYALEYVHPNRYYFCTHLDSLSLKSRIIEKRSVNLEGRLQVKLHKNKESGRFQDGHM